MNTFIVKQGKTAWAITVPGFITACLVLDDIYNYLLPRPILYFLVFRRHLDKPWFLSCWGDANLHYRRVLAWLCCCSFPLVPGQVRCWGWEGLPVLLAQSPMSFVVAMELHFCGRITHSTSTIPAFFACDSETQGVQGVQLPVRWHHCCAPWWKCFLPVEPRLLHQLSTPLGNNKCEFCSWVTRGYRWNP